MIYPNLKPAAPKLPRAPRKFAGFSTEFWRGLIVSTFIAVVVIVNLSVGVVMMFGGGKSPVFSEVANTSAPVTVITRPMLDGTFCHYTKIDNESGNMIEDKVEQCGVHDHDATGKTAFSWSGK